MPAEFFGPGSDISIIDINVRLFIEDLFKALNLFRVSGRQLFYPVYCGLKHIGNIIISRI